ncbi:uncharacterized protein UHO2_06797 [Ustilago hordei]|uniref:Uncharacterized protein n=1 Tax=Ustilago hordei TaxID=120017 RepID=I2FZ54_USTHO|nr:uncharacterized protein UHO2_06797 [Ustilago hordei]CCF52197.1 uncharacterized protein UHOR_08449 [Ustilago hordei]SYW83583.1 uncharacterized protein UHO2_06797 [Ustilago hordei]
MTSIPEATYVCGYELDSSSEQSSRETTSFSSDIQVAGMPVPHQMTGLTQAGTPTHLSQNRDHHSPQDQHRTTHEA